MTMRELAFRGVWLAEGSRREDARGSFERLVDLNDLRTYIEGAAVSYAARARNRNAGTIRGLHFQADPHGEAKTLWCETGAIYDVLVDVRSHEPTFGQWLALELRAEHPQALHVPAGVAHGYQTLVDDTTIVYLISGTHVPESARTIGWSDPALGITWPRDVSAMSDNDRSAPPMKSVL